MRVEIGINVIYNVTTMHEISNIVDALKEAEYKLKLMGAEVDVYLAVGGLAPEEEVREAITEYNGIYYDQDSFKKGN